MTILALLLIGFSVFSALSLALTHVCAGQYRGISMAFGLVLLAALAFLQGAHFALLYADVSWVETVIYRLALFAVAPAFCLFIQPLLREGATPAGWRLVWHAAPLAASLWLPVAVSLPLAFIVGAGYLVWLGSALVGLRRERARFGLEIRLLGAVFCVAIGVAVMGFFQTLLPHKLFYSLYACAIGVAFLGVQVGLSLRPTLAAEVSETLQTAAYANSSLNTLDCDAALGRLAALMAEGHIYTQSSLTLPQLAERVGVTTHQLSELLNARLGKGFARYLREARVAAAKTLLLKEANASVLSIGLSVGFTSQSTFYDAFREIEGMTPGQFRRLHMMEK